MRSVALTTQEPKPSKRSATGSALATATYSPTAPAAIGFCGVPTRLHPDDLGDLAGALALEMYSGEDSARKNRKRFVAAMLALGARECDIAEILQMDMPDLKLNFAEQLAGPRW
jgi:hypothetical protein